MSVAHLEQEKKGQVAIITGGAKGIGFGIATRMAQEGAAVALFDVDAHTLATARAKLEVITGAGLVVDCVVDVTDEAAVHAAVKTVVARLGRVDILVQAAGITGKTGIPTHQVESANFQLVMDINLRWVLTFVQNVACEVWVRAGEAVGRCTFDMVLGRAGCRVAAA